MKFSYDDYQLDFIKERLALRDDKIKILQNFRIAYETEKVCMQDIQEIASDCKEEIRELASRLLSDINAVPIAFERVTLELLQQAIAECLTPRPLGSYQVTEEVPDETGESTVTKTMFKEKVGRDMANLAKFIKLAQDERFFAKKLRLEKLSRGITQSDPILDSPGTPTITVYTGYDPQEHKLLVDSASDEEIANVQAEMDT